jgi:hypothetical protein
MADIEISIDTLRAAHALGDCEIVEVHEKPLIRRACICKPPKNGMIFRGPSCAAHGCVMLYERR